MSLFNYFVNKLKFLNLISSFLYGIINVQSRVFLECLYLSSAAETDSRFSRVDNRHLRLEEGGFHFLWFSEKLTMCAAVLQLRVPINVLSNNMSFTSVINSNMRLYVIGGAYRPDDIIYSMWLIDTALWLVVHHKNDVTFTRLRASILSLNALFWMKGVACMW